MKRILSLLLILVLSFSIMACGTDKEETKNDTTDTSTPVEDTDKVENTDKDAPKEEVELVVSAAASLTDAMGEIAVLIKEDENINLTSTFDSSGTLQKQIEEGAPTDVFISAGQKQMDALEEKDLIAKDSRIDLLRNKLVLLVPEDNPDNIKNIQDVIDKKVQIAIAETETVPVGQYSKKALEDLGLWDKLETDNIIQSKNVSEVLSQVEQGNVSAGMVYSSDAVRGEKVKEVEVFDEELHGPIIYPAAVIEASTEQDAGKIFSDYLQTGKVKAIFEKYGFEMAK